MTRMEGSFIRPGSRWKKFTSTHSLYPFILKDKAAFPIYSLKNVKVLGKRVKNFEIDNEIIHEKYAIKKKIYNNYIL